MDMIDIQRRLVQLRDELSVGERAVHELSARRDELTTAMLRISGAIQVLEELLAGSDGSATDSDSDSRVDEPWTAAH